MVGALIIHLNVDVEEQLLGVSYDLNDAIKGLLQEETLLRKDGQVLGCLQLVDFVMLAHAPQ